MLEAAVRERALLTMADMNMEEMMKDDPDMEMTPADMISGWAKTGAPEGDKSLSYADLRYAGIQTDTRQPERTIDVKLGGNMERFIWTINGKKFSDAEPMHLRYGERVRLKFTPELHFRLDDRFERADRISQLLNDERVRADLEKKPEE